jgi:hypothetical protein
LEQQRTDIHPKSNEIKKNPIKPRDQRLECDKCDYFCIRKYDMRKHMIGKHKELCQAKKCNVCDKTFLENCDLETHIKDNHEAKTFKCDECGKTFVLKWRLRKHLSVHTTEKYYHYFNNEKVCPFEEIGCKFRHEPSTTCKFKQCNNLLCQYRHVDHIGSQESLIEPTNVSEQISTIYTSTPKAKMQKLQCENCEERSQCEVCYVDQYIQNLEEDKNFQAGQGQAAPEH